MEMSGLRHYELFFAKIMGQRQNNNVTPFATLFRVSHDGLGQAWDRLGHGRSRDGKNGARGRTQEGNAVVGYSGTPLAAKLGIKSSFVVATVNAPANYPDLLAPLPDGVSITDVPRGGADLVHLFTNSRNELFSGLAELRNVIKQNGSIWVSWYKKTSKLPTEITEETVREAAFPLGLVDIKVCAVDDKWSGLKLVIRKENRI